MLPDDTTMVSFYLCYKSKKQ